ncbi:hypothetical protein AGR1B_pa0300 [Agrobacterium fabacearum S56]|nr:hypothetical protein AGR1B_pa0300 [Agrobacterium fabacearum S56]
MRRLLRPVDNGTLFSTRLIAHHDRTVHHRSVRLYQVVKRKGYQDRSSIIKGSALTYEKVNFFAALPFRAFFVGKTNWRIMVLVRIHQLSYVSPRICSLSRTLRMLS